MMQPPALPLPRLDRATVRRTLLWLVIAIGVTGCPHQGPEGETLRLPLVTTDDPDAEADMRAAREAAEAGNDEEARERYERFLSEHPDDPLVPIAHLGLGRLLLADGDIAAAREHFAVVQEHPDSAVSERGRFYDGVALHLQGDHEAALEILRPFVGRTVDPAETAILLRTIAAASEEEGDRVGAIEALDTMLRESVPDEDRSEARARLEAIVSEQATEDDIARAADMLPHDGVAWPMVADRAMRQAYEHGDLERVRDLADGLREQGVELDEDQIAMALRAERRQQADAHAVGAILPLSGRGREVGQHALRGLMLAAGSPPDGPIPEGAPQLVFRDDAGDPDRAAQAVEDLVSLHRVIAIVGPLAGPTARAAAARAQELGVPLITLTPAEGVAETGPMVFRLFFTPRSETRELVAAARARGAQRFALLLPDTPYGTTMGDAFTASVQSAGGEVVSRQTYDADATSFGEQIAQLRRARFDALFVPDGSRKVALIAPALATAGLWSSLPDAEAPREGRNITLLLPSVAFGEQLAHSSGRYLQGALFSSPFHAPTATGEGREFADRFQERYGDAPDMYAAFGYDAMRMVVRAVDRGATERAAVAEQLAAMRGVETAGPTRGFGPGGEPARGTRVLELRGNLFAPVDVPPPSLPPSSKP